MHRCPYCKSPTVTLESHHFRIYGVRWYAKCHACRASTAPIAHTREDAIAVLESTAREFERTARKWAEMSA